MQIAREFAEAMREAQSAQAEAIQQLEKEWQSDARAICNRFDEVAERLEDHLKKIAKTEAALAEAVSANAKAVKAVHADIGRALKLIQERENGFAKHDEALGRSLQEVLRTLQGLDEGVRLLIAKTLLQSLEV